MPLDCLDRVSAFESMRVYGGRIFCWEKHYERLSESCRALGQALPVVSGAVGAGFKPAPTEWVRWIHQTLKESGYSDAILRLSVHWDGTGAGRLVAFVREFHSHPEVWYEKGVTLRTAISKRWTLKAQDPQIKASQYVSGVLAFLDKNDLSAHELLFFGPGGTVAEGAVSNLFLIKRKCLLTPSVGSGILKGVTRGLVLELAEKRRWPVSETCLTRHDFYTADECFLTNTSSEILPVVTIDGRRIGDGKPGPCTRMLAEDFKKLR